MTSCRLCRRSCEPASSLCEYHLLAKRKIESGYVEWREAYGSLTWDEYLRKIARNPETGQWVREVAEVLSGGPIE